MTNVEKAVNDFYGCICQRIDAVYDPARWKTREDLVRLIDDEVIRLMELQQFTNDGLRDACYKGLKEDGVEFPEILWARHVGTKIKVPYYSSIREEVPPEQPADAAPPVAGRKAVKQDPAVKAGASKAPLFQAGVTVAGAGLTVAGAARAIAAGIAETSISPISIGLIVLGICMTAAGVVALAAPGRKQTSRPAAPAQPSEEKIVENILSEQRDRCREYAKEWCGSVLAVVRDAAEQDRAGK